MSYVTHTIIDRSGESSFTRHYLPTITAANYIVVTGNTPATQNVGSLRVALGAITNGNFVRHEVTAVEGTQPLAEPASPQAQREVKLLIRYISSASRRGSIEIPGPDLALLASPGTDVVDLTITEMANFIGVFETETRDSYGDTITVTDARIVGRRL